MTVSRELISLTYYKSKEGKYHCPLTFKVFNDSSHIVAIATTGKLLAATPPFRHPPITSRPGRPGPVMRHRELAVRRMLSNSEPAKSNATESCARAQV